MCLLIRTKFLRSDLQNALRLRYKEAVIKYLILFLLISCGKPITNSEQDTFYNALLGVSEEVYLGTPLSFQFDLLPLKGSVSSNGNLWSGDSWRLNRGAINFRWNSSQGEAFNYLSPTPRELVDIPLEKLKQLAPAEKYDIFMGRYDYPLKYEVDTLARSGMESWEGLCHGWAAATMNFKTPKAIILKNPDGIEVPFASSDIKALLSYAYSKLIINDESILGNRCERAPLMGEDFCDEDLPAHTFHAVITNKIGLRGQSFIADIDRYNEVWNHPVVGYETTILSSRRNGSGRVVTISTQIRYLDLVEQNSWEHFKNIYSYMTFKYEVSLDQYGAMVSGRWLSRERPDFLWETKSKDAFQGYLSGIKDLIK